MENKVYTQSELKAQNIITTDYVPNLEPGEFIAVLDMKAEARNCLRVFFTFEDGRDHGGCPVVEEVLRLLFLQFT